MLRKMMRRFAALSLVLLVVLAATPAFAAEPDEILAELEFRNYAAENGTGSDINGLEDLIDDVDAAERGLYFVRLRTDPSGGNDLFAADLIGLGLFGTVVVISANEIGAASTDFDDDAVDSAIDAAFDDFADRDDLGAFKAFADGLPDAPQPVEPTTAVNEPVPSAQSSSGGTKRTVVVPKPTAAEGEGSSWPSWSSLSD